MYSSRSSGNGWRSNVVRRNAMLFMNELVVGTGRPSGSRPGKYQARAKVFP